MGYISLPLNVNAIIGITNYYCVLSKIVVLHDAIKTIQNGVFVFLQNKNENLFFFQKVNKKTVIKKQVGCIFLKKRVFLNPDYLSILFCNFPLISRSGISYVTISLIGCAPHTWSIGP